MPKDNSLFKLDNLDYQYHYLNGSLQNFSPRLNGTWKMYNAIGKKSSKRISRILNNLKIEDVERELNELSRAIFEKKVFHLEVRLRQFIERQLIQYKPGKKSKADFTAVINDIKDNYGIEKFACWISKSKTIKLSLSKIRSIRKWPKWFTNYEFWQIHNDRDHEYNPSRIWNDIILKVDGCNQLLSLLFNKESCKELIAAFNSGMDVFLNINKDKKKNNKECNVSHDLSQLSSVQKEKSEDDLDGTPESLLQDEDEEETMAEETLKRYDGLLVASDDEDYDELPPKADYNEIGNDQLNDDLEKNKDESEKGHETVKSRYQLPELISGYYDGDGSIDDDLVFDEVAQEQISNKDHKKNRRGQRARRKIWEQKYGNKANHVIKERQVQLENKRKRQQEFEERKAKRIMKTVKASNFDDEISNLSKNDVPNKSETKGKSKAPLAEHPSWIAKRESESKLKNAKFEGRKIIFD